MGDAKNLKEMKGLTNPPNKGNRKLITLYSRQGVLMRDALEIQKKIDLVHKQFYFDKQYIEERKAQLLEEYACVMTELIKITADALNDSNKLMQNI